MLTGWGLLPAQLASQRVVPASPDPLSLQQQRAAVVRGTRFPEASRALGLRRWLCVSAIGRGHGACSRVVAAAVVTRRCPVTGGMYWWQAEGWKQFWVGHGEHGIAFVLANALIKSRATGFLLKRLIGCLQFLYFYGFKNR